VRVVACDCKATITQSEFAEHARTCEAHRGRSVSASPPRGHGPDILVYLGEHNVVLDITVVSAESDTHCDVPLERLFDKVRKDKHKKYDDLVAKANQHLIVIAFSEAGAPCTETVKFVKRVCETSGSCPHEALKNLCAAVGLAHGGALRNAERTSGAWVDHCTWRPKKQTTVLLAMTPAAIARATPVQPPPLTQRPTSAELLPTTARLRDNVPAALDERRSTSPTRPSNVARHMVADTNLASATDGAAAAAAAASAPSTADTALTQQQQPTTTINNTTTVINHYHGQGPAPAQTAAAAAADAADAVAELKPVPVPSTTAPDYRIGQPQLWRGRTGPEIMAAASPTRTRFMGMPLDVQFRAHRAPSDYCAWAKDPSETDAVFFNFCMQTLAHRQTVNRSTASQQWNGKHLAEFVHEEANSRGFTTHATLEAVTGAFGNAMWNLNILEVPSGVINIATLNEFLEHTTTSARKNNLLTEIKQSSDVAATGTPPQQANPRPTGGAPQHA
jgi:hypothetical protein